MVLNYIVIFPVFHEPTKEKTSCPRDAYLFLLTAKVGVGFIDLFALIVLQDSPYCLVKSLCYKVGYMNYLMLGIIAPHHD